MFSYSTHATKPQFVYLNPDWHEAGHFYPPCNFGNTGGPRPYAFFRTWKKPCYMKLVLVGLYCGPLLTLIPPLIRT